MMIPYENGAPNVAKATALPAEITSEAIVVVTGITANKTDAPFSLAIAPYVAPSDAGADASADGGTSGSAGDSKTSSGGCALAKGASSFYGSDALALLFGLFVGARRRRGKRAEPSCSSPRQTHA